MAKGGFRGMPGGMNQAAMIKQAQKMQQDMMRMQEELENSRPNAYCKHAVINAVLSEKEKTCTELGCSFETDLIIPGKLNVEPLNICSIFSNLLDNAIEAVGELPEKERKISVHGELRGNYLFVKVKNPTTKEHAQRKRRQGRGYGTQILQDIAKKYDGQYVASFEKGIYTAMVGVKAV